MSERRDELIEKALEYFLEHGLAGLSLRPLAESIGTSARLLVYHFGSKDGLVTAVMGEVQARAQKSFATAAARHATEGAKSLMHGYWTWLTHPSNLRSMRLVFEVQALALQNPAEYAHYLEGTSSSWLELIEVALPPSKKNRVIATLCAGVMDGLFIEYLSTGDRRRTTKALDLFTQMMQVRRRDA
jgi:AcrR family transcriptional regulator